MIFRRINSFDFHPAMAALYFPNTEAQSPRIGDIGFKRLRLRYSDPYKRVDIPPDLLYFLEWNSLTSLRMPFRFFYNAPPDDLPSPTIQNCASAEWIRILGQAFERPGFSVTLTNYILFGAGINERPDAANVTISKSPDLVAEGIGERIAKMQMLSDVYERTLFSSSGRWEGEESICLRGLRMTLKFEEPKRICEVAVVVNGMDAGYVEPESQLNSLLAMMVMYSQREISS